MNASDRYDLHLKHIMREQLPEGTLLPRFASEWPAENVLLLDEYHAWLKDGGAGPHAIETNYLPTAGLILGLNLRPHARLNLVDDLEKVLVFTRLRPVSPNKVKIAGYGVDKLRRFLRWKRGLGEVVRLTDYDVARHTQGLPEWLVQELLRYQHIMEKNWRPARIKIQIRSFWYMHLHIWKYLCFEQGVRQLSDIKRRQITDMIARDIQAGYSASSINTCVILWKGFLVFLHTEGYVMPQSLFQVKTIQQPESLPKYFTDDEMIRVRGAIEQQVREARNSCQLRDALLLKAAFYLLWHGGLRLGEVEELLLENIDLAGKRLTVINGKGMKDRTVYLTSKAIQAIREYLPVRGPGSTEHLLLYNHEAMKHELIHRRLKVLGDHLGVKVYPHRLRHSAATQLLNAGCRITSIQKILGHKRLDTTLRYARVYDETIADEFYTAMERVEQRLSIEPVEEEAGQNATPLCPEDEVIKVQVLSWIERLAGEELSPADRQLVAASLKMALFRDMPGVGLPAG